MQISLEDADRLVEQGRMREAEGMYEMLLAHNADRYELLNNAGIFFIKIKRYGIAAALLEAALRIAGKKSDVMANLAICYKNTGQDEKYKALLKDAMNYDPSPACIANYAALFIESDNQKELIEKSVEAIRKSPDLAVAHWNLSLALLAAGVWDKAWDEHEWGLKSEGMRGERNTPENNIPMWDGTNGKTLWIWGEQGIGDEIMFASMLPDVLKGGNKVIFECHKRMVNIFKKAFPEITVYGTREDAEIHWLADHKIDARIAVGSLGKFYRRSREAFPGTPYLKADPVQKGEKFRVGISWTGGFKVGRIKKRTVPLSWWKPILDIPNVEFVSLQYTNQQEEIDLVNALGYDIKVMDELVKAEDYSETARLVKSCDLVISCCTSVIHLAGALGVPCWVMTPKWPAWRYQNEGGMPWYRSVRLYRQPEAGSDGWLPVIHRVALDLNDKVNPPLAA